MSNTNLANEFEFKNKAQKKGADITVGGQQQTETE